MAASGITLVVVEAQPPTVTVVGLRDHDVVDSDGARQVRRMRRSDHLDPPSWCLGVVPCRFRRLVDKKLEKDGLQLRVEVGLWLLDQEQRELGLFRLLQLEDRRSP
jgi:hypothetical protein